MQKLLTSLTSAFAMLVLLTSLGGCAAAAYGIAFGAPAATIWSATPNSPLRGYINRKLTEPSPQQLEMMRKLEENAAVSEAKRRASEQDEAVAKRPPVKKKS